MQINVLIILKLTRLKLASNHRVCLCWGCFYKTGQTFNLYNLNNDLIILLGLYNLNGPSYNLSGSVPNIPNVSYNPNGPL